MDTFAPASFAYRSAIWLTTRQPLQFVDLTDRLVRTVHASRIGTGLLNVQTRHTTTALVVNEDEPLLREDFEAMLERLAPRTGRYRHDDMARRPGVPDGERANGHAHCRALLLPSSACLNIVDGTLALGHWQRVFLVELDGPREREVSVVAFGEPGL
jgi:secondary thiamine-phosphate synthase enzyme